jgi:hypothetical protein
MLLGEISNLWPALHRAIIVDEFRQHTHRFEPGKLAKINARLGMAGPHQHAALAGDQRKHMAGAHEIIGADIAIGERAHGVGAFFSRDAGGQAVFDIHRDRERGGQRRIIGRHHRVEPQALGAGRRHGRADDAGGVAHDERHRFGRAVLRRDEQITLVLAVIIIGDDQHRALLEGVDGGLHMAQIAVQNQAPTWPLWRKK